MHSTSRNSACSTSIQSQLAKHKVLTLVGLLTSGCKIGPKSQNKRRTSSKSTKISRKSLWEQILTLDEINLHQEVLLLNVSLVSNGQRQGIDTRRASNKQVHKRPQMNRRSKNKLQKMIIWRKFCF